jgi:hypothetical protein
MPSTSRVRISFPVFLITTIISVDCAVSASPALIVRFWAISLLSCKIEIMATFNSPLAIISNTKSPVGAFE